MVLLDKIQKKTALKNWKSFTERQQRQKILGRNLLSRKKKTVVKKIHKLKVFTTHRC